MGVCKRMADERYKGAAVLAVAIARALQLPAEEIGAIRLGAAIFDLGKMSIPAEIMNRPGRLHEFEFELIKTHVQAGYDIVKSIDFRWPIAQMILQHHERLDGSGYPNGLKGDAISLDARIIAVADVVEAMCSHRPYRAALGIDAALKEIRRLRGSQFDPAVVDACVNLFETSDFEFPLA
jgi:HD-GYP domain-containing protein (c-di-GMP phosphodiesterase class II)